MDTATYDLVAAEDGSFWVIRFLLTGYEYDTGAYGSVQTDRLWGPFSPEQAAALRGGRDALFAALAAAPEHDEDEEHPPELSPVGMTQLYSEPLEYEP